MTQHTDPDPYVGTAAFAAAIGVSQSTVRRLVHAGAIKPDHVAPGGAHGSYVFTRAELARYQEEAGQHVSS